MCVIGEVSSGRYIGWRGFEMKIREAIRLVGRESWRLLVHRQEGSRSGGYLFSEILQQNESRGIFSLVNKYSWPCRRRAE